MYVYFNELNVCMYVVGWCPCLSKVCVPNMILLQSCSLEVSCAIFGMRMRPLKIASPFSPRRICMYVCICMCVNVCICVALTYDVALALLGSCGGGQVRYGGVQVQALSAAGQNHAVQLHKCIHTYIHTYTHT